MIVLDLRLAAGDFNGDGFDDLAVGVLTRGTWRKTCRQAESIFYTEAAKAYPLLEISSGIRIVPGSPVKYTG